MATGILVTGQSGSGKSTGAATLNPAETLYINFLGKPLPFKGWKSQYTTLSKSGGNYIEVLPKKMTIPDVLAMLDYVNANRPDIKNVVFDDLIYILTDNIVSNPKKSFDKWDDVFKLGYSIFKKALEMRDDIFVFVITHDVYEEGVQKIKLPGKALERLSPEGTFTITLCSKVDRDPETGEIRYQLVTNNDGERNLPKSPRGMFEELYIPNDYQLVIDKINEFNN